LLNNATAANEMTEEFRVIGTRDVQAGRE
jgi:hypothetical protein